MIVNLHVTSDSNLRCDYCYASPKGAARMDLSTAAAALKLAEREALAGASVGNPGRAPRSVEPSMT